MPDPDLATRLRTAVTRTDRLLSREVAGSGLTRTQFSVLGAVTRAGSLRLGELVEREGLNPTMLSRIVGRLVSTGLLRRSPSPDDGRAVVLEVSGEGTRLYRRLQAERTALVQDYLDGLAPEAAARLAAALPELEGLAKHLRTRTSARRSA